MNNNNSNIPEAKKYFDEHGYTIFSEAIPPHECQRLVDHMFNLFKEGKLVRDEQCPLSDSCYGDPEFDNLLVNMADPLGKHLGKKLIPQYTYARIYRPGEELKPHRDRPECEISATICLGYKAENPWPIYMGDERGRVDMRAGDMVAYKGCDITHWRTPFKGDEGDWCVQLFIHYTDAEGPYKHLKYDGRDKLGVKKDRPKGMHPDRVEQNGEQQANQIMFGNPIFGGILLPRYVEDYPGYSYLDPKAYPDLTFTEEECEKIIDIQRKSYGSPASVGGGDQGRIVKEIRKADVYEVPMDRFAWVYEKIARSVQVLNEGYFKFDLLGITHGLQLLHYKYNPEEDVQGHYDWHQDVGPGTSSYRKISYVAMLSDPYKYKGGSLELMNINGGTVAPKDRGGVHMFPSYMMHRVTPLEEGERFSLVIWVHGPYRFR